jgi:hypothetical protein
MMFLREFVLSFFLIVGFETDPLETKRGLLLLLWAGLTWLLWVVKQDEGVGRDVGSGWGRDFGLGRSVGGAAGSGMFCFSPISLRVGTDGGSYSLAGGDVDPLLCRPDWQVHQDAGHGV